MVIFEGRRQRNIHQHISGGRCWSKEECQPYRYWCTRLAHYSCPRDPSRKTRGSGNDESECTGNYADSVILETIKKSCTHRGNFECWRWCYDAIGTIKFKVDRVIKNHSFQMEAYALLALIATDYPNTKLDVAAVQRWEDTLIQREFRRDRRRFIGTLESQRQPCSPSASNAHITQLNNVASFLKGINRNWARVERIPLIVYPNSGEIYDKTKRLILAISYYTLEDIQTVMIQIFLRSGILFSNKQRFQVSIAIRWTSDRTLIWG